jgi:lysophospholipase L1-like esterase
MYSFLARRPVGSLFFGCCLAVSSLAACTGADAPNPTPGASGSGGQPTGGATSAGATSGGAGSGGAPSVAGAAGNASAGAQANAGSGGNVSAGAGGAAGGVGGVGGSAAGAGGGAGAAGVGGAAGSAGSAGSGGMAAYNPCPTNGDPCRIMPLGDSITDGAGSSTGAGYRLELFRLSLVNNKKLTFVGSHESGPDMVNNTPFPKKQEGHSGWTIDDDGGRSGLYPQVQSWLAATPPDIVTLMIGTNDVDLSLDLGNAGMRLGLLLDRIAMYAPKALIVVAQMVPTTDDTENQRVMTYNATIPGLVQARAATGKHIAMVDMYGGFTKNANFKTEYMSDKLHPKDAGYVAMANIWWAAVAPLLPNK